MMSKVDAVLANGPPPRHTFFQLNFFVLGKEPTNQAKMKRCVDELRSRKQSVLSLEAELGELKDRNELLSREMGNDPVLERMRLRKIEANARSMADVLERLKSNEEEMTFFVEAFNRINQVEPIKPWDDVEVQTEYWNAKIMEEFRHRLIMHLPIDVELIRTALCLPDATPVKRQVLELVRRQGDKLDDR